MQNYYYYLINQKKSILLETLASMPQININKSKSNSAIPRIPKDHFSFNKLSYD